MLGYASKNKNHFSMGAQPVCFATGTQIETVNGYELIENLTVGTMVKTLDAGFQPIRWIGSHHFNQYSMNENCRPIRIHADALSKGIPRNDLLVSVQHRIFVASKIARNLFDTENVLIAAKHLLDLPGVEIALDVTTVTYWHLFFDQHQIIRANGAPAESLYPGPLALQALPPCARAEVEAFLSGSGIINIDEHYHPARPFLRGKDAKRFIARCIKKNEPVIQSEFAATLWDDRSWKRTVIADESL